MFSSLSDPAVSDPLEGTRGLTFLAAQLSSVDTRGASTGFTCCAAVGRIAYTAPGSEGQAVPGSSAVSRRRAGMFRVGVGAAVAASGGVHGFVPALTSFVGRAGEVAKVAALLAEYRLVTVTGPGGVGKTRLACEVARRAEARFADGAWLVELAAVQNPALVPAAVAAVMGIPQSPGSSLTQTLAGVLSRRQLLLVLDNCEHVLGAAAELCACLLPAADDVTVLATSREPLGIAGETRYRLGPLPVPRSG